MKLTEERLVKMILEELDAMGEVFRAKGESDEEYAERKAAAQKGTKGLGRMGTPRSAGKTPEEKAAAKLTSTARMFMRLMDDGKKTPPISKELKREIERLRKLEEEK
tara:strand:+ start:182 stop:502 length:321 start_codon:yes stop_codon:yes gene_type:complete